MFRGIRERSNIKKVDIKEFRAYSIMFRGIRERSNIKKVDIKEFRAYSTFMCGVDVTQYNCEESTHAKFETKNNFTRCFTLCWIILH